MSFKIEGFWSSRASEYNPQKKIKTTVQDYRYFFRLLQDAKSRTKQIIGIFVDGKQAVTLHDWMSSDGREDDYFDVPLTYRTPGEHTLQFKVFDPVSSDADAVAQPDPVYESEVFILEFIM